MDAQPLGKWLVVLSAFVLFDYGSLRISRSRYAPLLSSPMLGKPQTPHNPKLLRCCHFGMSNGCREWARAIQIEMGPQD